MALIPCKHAGDSLCLKHASLSGKGKGRCLDRNALAESAPMNGRGFGNGRCGLNRSCTSKSDPSSCSTKPQGSEQRKSMSPNVRLPAKRKRLNDTGCKACLHPRNKAEREKLAGRSHRRSANSSWTCTLNYLPCQPREIAEVCYIRVRNTITSPLLTHKSTVCFVDCT
jgi:hypothetical protein